MDDDGLFAQRHQLLGVMPQLVERDTRSAGRHLVRSATTTRAERHEQPNDRKPAPRGRKPTHELLLFFPTASIPWPPTVSERTQTCQPRGLGTGGFSQVG